MTIKLFLVLTYDSWGSHAIAIYGLKCLISGPVLVQMEYVYDFGVVRPIA